jgi:hypothetical protein
MKEISVVKPVSKLAPLVLAVSCSLGLLSGCSSSSDSAAVAPVDASISGTIVAAPVSGADVSVEDGAGNVVVEAVKTDADGNYTLVIPEGSMGQDLIIKSTGGTFLDEATGGNPGTAGVMYAYASSGSLSNGSMVSATPGSTIIAELVMNHGKTRAEAEAAFAAAFAYTPDVSVTPADATTAPAADETDDETLAGFRAGAFSQLAMDLGLSQDDQFALFTALAQDLSDDKLDGVDASGAVAIGTTGEFLEADIQNRFSMALVNFNNSAYNLTGLDNNEFGDIPFAKVALTTNYQIEYKQTSMMGPVNGKDTFQIHVTKRSDGSDATGLANMLMPTMYMLGTHKHSTPMPVPAITEDGNGLYTVTLYYLMPTAMGGYWDLKFTIDGETTHFYPTVMMAMGDTPQVRLKGVDDKIMSMMTGTQVGRTYFIFKNSLTGGMGNYDFSVFVAAQESMMSFPPVTDGLNLNSGALVVDINTTEVSISVNGGSFAPASTNGNDGIWSASGISLNEGVENQIKIMLTVNNEVKTTDGMVLDPGVNDYQTFTVTPGGM